MTPGDPCPSGSSSSFPHPRLTRSLLSLLFGFPPESCFLFALTRQKLPPFCQQGYMRKQGLMVTESLRRHGVESGLLRDYATASQHLKDHGQQPANPGPVGHSLTAGTLVQSLHSNKEEL